MANPEDDAWWESTTPETINVPKNVYSGVGDENWWDTTKPKVNHTALDPTPEELEDDDYWNSFTSWTRRQGAVTRTLGRIPVRAGEDLYNALNDFFEFSTRARWEDEIFDEPQSAQPRTYLCCYIFYCTLWFVKDFIFPICSSGKLEVVI